MILYINGNYPFHSLHSELVLKLAELGNEVTVFVPIRGKESDGQFPCNHPRVKVVYSSCLRTLDRIFLIHKTHRIVKEIEKQVNISNVKCILAGTVYSDGAAAYLLHKKYGMPFSVAIRETDVTYQMKWRPYLNRFIRKLLNEVDKIIFLSPAYQRYLTRFKCDKAKYTVIPNAVNDYWFFNHTGIKRKLHDPLSMIYVGEISERKNVTTSISVLAELIHKHIQIVFHIVGSGDEEKKCRDLAVKLGVSDRVFFHGWQGDKETIRNFYDQADIFVMPSLRETFGTVYIEALSQGLPVIYTSGQGIDGYFEQGTVGYSCDPRNVSEIASAIESISEHYETISSACILASEQFRWEVIARQYQDIVNAMRNR